MSSIGQPTLIQETLSRYLDQGGLDRHLRGLRSAFARLVVRHMEAVASPFPTRTNVVQPSGGFLLWVELPQEFDTFALHGELLDIGLGIAPGVMFSASNRFRNALRINCGIEWSDASELAYEAYGKLLSRCGASSGHPVWIRHDRTGNRLRSRFDRRCCD